MRLWAITMNRKKVLDAARKRGFTGGTLAELQAWQKSAEGCEFEDANGVIDITKAWANNPAEKLNDDPGDEDDSERKATEAQKTAAARREVKNPAGEVEAKNFSGNGYTGKFAAARKRYQSKISRGEACFDDADDAELFAAQARLQILGHSEYPQKKTDLEIARKTMTTTAITGGSAYVPDDYVPDPIRLRETYGVAKQLATVETMSRDVQSFPNEVSDVTVYYPGEAGEITASDTSTNLVKLVARKMAALTKVSSEMFTDAAVSVADRIAVSANYAIEKKLDEDFFLGDSTATYGHALGLRGAWDALGTITNDYYGSLVAATGNLFSELTITDFYKMKARLPATWSGSAKWVMHKRFFYEVVAPLARSGAGYTLADMQSDSGMTFLGDPVVFAQALPRVAADSTPVCYYGDLKVGAKIGEVRNSMRFAMSDQRFFETDVIAFRVTQRNAINVLFGCGNYDATEANRVAGPIIGLKLIT